MIRRMAFSGLLDTGPVCGPVWAIRDGFVNLYVLKAADGLVCFDAGWRSSAVARGFEGLGFDPGDVAVVFLTHLHWDHSRSASLFRNAKVLVGNREIPAHVPRRLWPAYESAGRHEELIVEAAGISVRVVGTPGHTSDSLSYLANDRFLFTGDTIRLQAGEVCPFPFWLNKDNRALAESIRRLAALEGTELILTAHTGYSAVPARAFRRWCGSATEEIAPKVRA